MLKDWNFIAQDKLNRWPVCYFLSGLSILLSTLISDAITPASINLSFTLTQSKT